MNNWGQVCKRVWKMEYFGLKLGQDLGNRAAHPYQEFRGVAPPGLGFTIIFNNPRLLQTNSGGFIKILNSWATEYCTWTG